MLKKIPGVRKVYYSLDPEEDKRIKAERAYERTRVKRKKWNRKYWAKNKEWINRERIERKRQEILETEGYDIQEGKIRTIVEISYEDSSKTPRNSKLV